MTDDNHPKAFFSAHQQIIKTRALLTSAADVHAANFHAHQETE